MRDGETSSVTSSRTALPMVSVDDHIMESAGMWNGRLPKAMAELGPQVRREEYTYTDYEGHQQATTMADVWHYDGKTFPLTQIMGSAGMTEDEVADFPTTFDEVMPGCYDPVARLAAMDRDDVEISLGFPNLVVRFCGQLFLEASDKDVALECVKAYNDFLVDDWMAAGPGRLYGAGILPLWDPQLAAAEVERIAARGINAICFSELPTKLGLPSLYTGEWERLLSVCGETETAIAIHIGSSSTILTSSEDAPLVVQRFNHHANASLSLSDWIVSGAFVRHPQLRVLFSETQAGWMPFVLGRMDATWERNYSFLTKYWDLPEKPSTYMRNVYACITEDPAAISFINEFGTDNLCYETDYPHPDSAWPNSRALADELFETLSDEDYVKVTRTNGLRALNLPDRLAAPADAAISA